MIPKIIHYCWLSNDPYPALNKKCIESWKQILQDYQFVLWDLTKSQTIESQWINDTIAAGKYAFAADYIRIYAVLNYGGIYLDSDVEILNNFDPFLNHDMFIGFDYHNDLEPAIFGAIPNHPLFSHLADYFKNRSFFGENGKMDLKPLPTIFNDLLLKIYKLNFNGTLQHITENNIVVYPYSYFSPKNLYFNKIKLSKETVSIHHFGGSWVEKNTIFYLKKVIHQIIYAIGGRTFHYMLIKLIRRIF